MSRDAVDWSAVTQMVGDKMSRTLRLWTRSAMDPWNYKLFLALATCAQEIALAESKADKAAARQRGMFTAQQLVAGRQREARAESFSRRRDRLAQHLRIIKLFDELLIIRRGLLPDPFAAALSSPGNNLKALQEALARVAIEPEPAAGEYILLLAQRCSRAAARAGAAERKVMPPPPAHEPYGECAICQERKPRAPLAACGHASSCRRCLHLHVTERLRQGCPPACPLCRSPLHVGEVCFWLGSHNLIPAAKRRAQRESLERGSLP